MYSFVKKILITLESRPIILLKIKLNILKSSNRINPRILDIVTLNLSFS